MNLIKHVFLPPRRRAETAIHTAMEMTVGAGRGAGTIVAYSNITDKIRPVRFILHPITRMLRQSL